MVRHPRVRQVRLHLRLLVLATLPFTANTCGTVVYTTCYVRQTLPNIWHIILWRTLPFTATARVRRRGLDVA